MRDVHEYALLDLGVALRHPGAQALCVQVGMPGERHVDGVDDVVQEALKTKCLNLNRKGCILS